MIDLEKEKEAYAKYNRGYAMSPDECAEEAGWIARAELAQDEINNEREQATEYYIDCEYLKAEITELKRKLEKLESGEFVLVPRMPTKNMLDAGFVDGDYGCSTLQIYKAMIEAVEKEHE